MNDSTTWTCLVIGQDYGSYYTLPGRNLRRASGNALDISTRKKAMVRFPDGTEATCPLVVELSTSRYNDPGHGGIVIVKEETALIEVPYKGLTVRIPITDVDVLASEWTLP